MRILVFLFTLLLSFPGSAGLFNTTPKYLSSAQAFAFSYQVSADKLLLDWQIADGYYLYQKEIRVHSEQATLGELRFPQAEKHQDEFFGMVNIFRRQLHLDVPFDKLTPSATVEVNYQGCTKGFCYPPETVSIVLDKQAVGSVNHFAKNDSVQTAYTVRKAEQDNLAEQLSANRFSIFWFFIFGLGLAFTPCVLPMLPLLSAIVIGSNQRPNSLRAFLLSAVYVQGMALTYTLLGLVVAAMGLPFQIALQSPAVLFTLAILFTLLACSMFGLFTLQLPLRWQQALNQLSQRQTGGSFVSVFIMGMIAGLVASPCTSAPLSGALLYVAQSGDLLTGGLALYLLALGMGIPLMLITLFGNSILPKSGDWLLKVKSLFGFVMLALPVFLLSRIWPEFEPLMWSALMMALLIWTNNVFFNQKWLRIVLLIAFAFSAKPWVDLFWQPTTILTQTPSHFTRIQSLDELKQQLTAANGKKVMLDLYADWCVACKEFEKFTFNAPQVKTKLEQMLVLQVDMTKNSPQNDELMKQFNVLGLPTILFFDENGNELSQARVTGFMHADDFVDWLNNLSRFGSSAFIQEGKEQK